MSSLCQNDNGDNMFQTNLIHMYIIYHVSLCLLLTRPCEKAYKHLIKEHLLLATFPLPLQLKMFQPLVEVDRCEAESGLGSGKKLIMLHICHLYLCSKSK